MNKLEAIRYAGRVNSNAIKYGFSIAKIGVSLLEIDAAIEKYFIDNNCVPVFKGYRGFPAACCLSPNDVVVHGVPSNYILKNSDLLTIDTGCSYEGWHVDAASTNVIGLGEFPIQRSLIYATRSILAAEMSVLRDGVSLLEIAKIAEATAKTLSVNLFHEFGGHKIGETLHIEPFIPNAIDPKLSKIKRWQLEREYDQYKLRAGDVICLEPVCTFGNTDIVTDEDGWTIRTRDGSLVGHEEKCLVILENGFEVLS